MLDQNDLLAIGALLKQTQDSILEKMDQRMDGIDRRFEAIEARLDAMDRRFEAIEARLEEMDRRFEAIEARLDAMDQRFEEMDQRFAAMDQAMKEMDDKIEHRTVFLLDEIERRTNKRFEMIMENLRILNEAYAVDRLERNNFDMLLTRHEALEGRVDRLEKMVM